MKRFLFPCVATYLAASLAFAPMARAQEEAANAQEGAKVKPRAARQVPKATSDKKAPSAAKGPAAAKAQPAAVAAPAKAPVVPPPPPAPLPPPAAKPPLPPPAPSAAPVPTAVGGKAAGTTELPPGEKEFNSCRKLPAGKRIVKLNLKPETELLDLIGWISSISCTQFLVSIPIQGKKVTVIAPQLITPEEAYRLFLAALDSVGLTVEPTGKFLRVVETSRARFTSLPFVGEKERLPHDRRYVTKLVRVSYLDANELTNTVLNRLKSEAGDIIAYRSSLVITDQAENIDRMVDIIRQFDNPSDKRDKVWMVRIKNTSAVDMAGRLAEVVPVQTVGTGQRRPGQPAPQPGSKPVNPPGELSTELWITKIIPDERSNSLIVVANERAYQWLLTIIKKLDVSVDDSRAEGKDGRFHIYNCANANCDELAATLSAITGVQVAGSLTGGPRRRGGTAPAAAPAANNNQQTGPNQYMFEGDVRITFDAPTNSLLIMSSFKDYQVLRRVIEKLDAPRKQVFVEAVILEVLLNKNRQVGISYHAGKPFDNLVAGKDALGLGGFNANQTLTAGMNPTNLLSSMGGLSAALFGEAIPAAAAQALGLSNVNIPSFGVFLQMVQNNSDVNVLSNPHILIMNNQEGEITVGENLPFQGAIMGGALSGGTAGSYMPYVSVNRQDVALKLKLLPSVNEHNMIRLDVEQEVSDVSNPNYNGLGPSTSKRSTKTTIVARDQQTVVIGGLMGDRMSETVQKVPILGDIPVLGFFFRNTQKEMRKSNIIIALTPYVVSDLSDLRRVAEKKLRERRDFIERFSSLEDNSSIVRGVEDYHRKRGMLEEINKTVREVEDEEKQLRVIREMDAESESTPIEPMDVSSTESDAAGASVQGSSSSSPAAPKPAPAPTGLTPPKQDDAPPATDNDDMGEPVVPADKPSRKPLKLTKPAKPTKAIKPQE